MKKVITADEKLQLMGILALAKQHQKIVDECYDGITRIIDEDSSLIHDSIYEEINMVDFDKLIERTGIEVEA